MDLKAQLIGYPRIGPNRELKRALERAWSGRMEPDAFTTRIMELRDAHLAEQREAIGEGRIMRLGVASGYARERCLLQLLCSGTDGSRRW